MAAACVESRPAPNGPDMFSLFYGNTDEAFVEGYNILTQLANNLLSQPGNQKYSRIKAKESLLSAMARSIKGLMDCVVELGYAADKQTDGKFMLFDSTSQGQAKKVVQFKKKIVDMHERRLKGEAFVASDEEGARGECASTLLPAPSMLENQTPNQEMLSRIKSSSEHVLIYEVPEYQKKARECIPVQRLTIRASKKFLEGKRAGSSHMLPDFLLRELLAWFKHEFFQWVDMPACDWCGGKTRGVGGVPPTPAELAWWGNRVESYQCELCGSPTRFPRYNHPAKLLETRRGRCGEWANCFALCCRAMGLETRYVLDFTDHVWVEVYSVSQKRWVHADPCENVCDTPLMYEVGWGKKLTYVFAFSAYDVQDVIWRYSAARDATLQRRTECGEGWIANVVNSLRRQRQAGFAADKRAVYQERAVKEMVEFFTPKVASEEETVGRQSGSVAWRSQRGEMGEGGAISYVIRPTERERQNKTLHVQYSCAGDRYVRSEDGTTLSGWRSLVYHASAVQRKEELDWKMVYLSRAEAAAEAYIVWRVSFADSRAAALAADEISLDVNHDCFENGAVAWTAFFGFQCCQLIPGKEVSFRGAALIEATGVTVLARLTGGTGANAWQHTQLFRQGLHDNRYPFSVKIKFK